MQMANERIGRYVRRSFMSEPWQQHVTVETMGAEPDPELEPPEPAHFARSRSHCNILRGARGEAGTGIFFRMRSRIRPNSVRLRPEPEPAHLPRVGAGAAGTFYSEPEPG